VCVCMCVGLLLIVAILCGGLGLVLSVCISACF